MRGSEAGVFAVGIGVAGKLFAVALLVSGCAKEKQGVTCAHPDPVTGTCLREENAVSYHDDAGAIVRRITQQDTAAAQQEVAGLKAESERLYAQIRAGQANAAQRQRHSVLEMALERVGQTIGGDTQEEVDIGTVPAVNHDLPNKKWQGVRLNFTFGHVEEVQLGRLTYGGEGQSLVFDFGEDFTKSKMGLSAVKIPVELSFEFDRKTYCATTEINHRYEQGRTVMEVAECGQ